MVRTTTKDQIGVVYPADLDTANYQGFGELFVLGAENAEVDSEYEIAAVLGDELVSYVGRQLQDNRSGYAIQVPSIGIFVFQLERLRRELPYLGTAQPEDGIFALSRIKFLRDDLLEVVAKEHQFYFVGESPMTQVLRT